MVPDAIPPRIMQALPDETQAAEALITGYRDSEDEEWQVLLRVRGVVDDEAWDSNDRKMWFKDELPADMDEEEAFNELEGRAIEMAETGSGDSTNYDCLELRTDDIDELMSILEAADKDWMNVKTDKDLTDEELEHYRKIAQGEADRESN